MNKQSSVDFILNAFNLLSDSDFKSWMLNNYDVIKAMHKEEIANAWNDGHTEGMEGGYCTTYEEYYNETFGDEKVL
jgi:hypothetical protein